MPTPGSTRRTLLGAAAALPWLGGIAGCTTPLPLLLPPPAAGVGDPAATARLRDSAEAHGLAAYRGLADINVSYDGQWRPLVDRIQPEVVDIGFRGSSQERLLPRGGLVAQAYRGAAGTKQVCWRRGSGPTAADATTRSFAGDAPHAMTGSGAVDADRATTDSMTSGGGVDRPAAGAKSDSAPAGGDRTAVASRGAGGDPVAGNVNVWFNGRPSADPAALDAAALVAEGYGLFLLGPLWLADRALPMRLAGSERVDGRPCDVLEVWLSPGLGRVALDRVALCIDRTDAVMRRVRFTLEGFAGTRGAVAEVDTFDHQRRFGVLWPMRSYERVVHPIALPAHDWHISGLDVNRGYAASDVSGPAFDGKAAAPAKPL